MKFCCSEADLVGESQRQRALAIFETGRDFRYKDVAFCELRVSAPKFATSHGILS